MTRLAVAIAIILVLTSFRFPGGFQESFQESFTTRFGSVSRPFASCPAAMSFDASSGRCKTQQTTTQSRIAICRTGWAKVPGEYGGHVCQRSYSTVVQTGTERVFTHNTYEDVWVSTGSRRMHVRDERVWVPPRTTIEPLVPPIQVPSGTTRERRCSYDPFAGQQCWYVVVLAYRWITTTTSTTPGYYTTVPIYEYVPTGYWNTVTTPHYAYQPTYETRTTWSTIPAQLAGCSSGWTQNGSRCERTTLGEPSAEPLLSCPDGTQLVAVSSGGGQLHECEPSSSETSQADTVNTETETSTDKALTEALGVRLASLGDAELTELGLTRCDNGLLSYVRCDSLPEREWEQDQDICVGLDGTTFTANHGGSCVTGSDSLVKCATPGDCDEVSVRTFCPAISELASTEIREQISSRGSESYRVCVFVCDGFDSLPIYVRERILQSSDYACADQSTVPTVPVTTTTIPTRVPTVPTIPVITPTTVPGNLPDSPDSPDNPDSPAPNCTAPSANDLSAAAVGFASPLRTADAITSPQRHLPGGGEHLIVAPGEGWLSVPNQSLLNFTDDAGCLWRAESVHVTWRELVPWRPADRRQMDMPGRAPHLVRQWEALDPSDQAIVRNWHRSAISSGTVSCDIAAAVSTPAEDCGWQMLRPAAFEWLIQVSFKAEQDGKQHRTRHDTTLRSGFELINRLSSYITGTIGFTATAETVRTAGVVGIAA